MSEIAEQPALANPCVTADQHRQTGIPAALQRAPFGITSDQARGPKNGGGPPRFPEPIPAIRQLS